ncbi:hypothetical protein [Flavivirga jejuensis]|uniref:Tellurite resistance protein TerB n=1 Tax=Flavivirga jejuensis TaxID=870487 RepID=A0ABT8WTU7_9FLAO|nr:hypothetical protein [Flavivirga jejuensis]MDO5976592.1 hypothetical protein [Flavivirga jejuensis]
MRVSLNKIALIEKLIFNSNSLNTEEKALFESYKILDSDFELDIENQKKTVDLILKSGRRELKQEINEVYNNLFHPNSKNVLKSRILNIFSK